MGGGGSSAIGRGSSKTDGKTLSFSDVNKHIKVPHTGKMIRCSNITVNIPCEVDEDETISKVGLMVRGGNHQQCLDGDWGRL